MEAIRAHAVKKARATVEKMEREGMLNPVDEWREEVKSTLAYPISIVYASVDRRDIQLRAAWLVLEFTMPKPVKRRANFFFQKFIPKRLLHQKKSRSTTTHHNSNSFPLLYRV